MKLLLWIKVIARAPVMWLTVLAGILTILAAELGELLGADHPVIVFLLRAVVWVGVGISIIRQVTPVLKQARGVLPTGEPATSNEVFLIREINQMRRVIKEGG